MIEKTEKRAYAVVAGRGNVPIWVDGDTAPLGDLLQAAGFQPGDEVEIRLRVAQGPVPSGATHVCRYKDCGFYFRNHDGGWSAIQDYCGHGTDHMEPISPEGKPLSPPSGQEVEGKPQALPEEVVCDLMSKPHVLGNNSDVPCVNPRPAHPPAARTEQEKQLPEIERHCWEDGPRVTVDEDLEVGSTCMLAAHGPEVAHVFTRDDQIQVQFASVSAAPVDPAPHAPSATPEPEKLGEEKTVLRCRMCSGIWSELPLGGWIAVNDRAETCSHLISSFERIPDMRAAPSTAAPTTKVGED